MQQVNYEFYDMLCFQVKDRLKPYVRDQYAIDLLDKLLCLDPRQRLNADDSLNHDFFYTDPMPADLSKVPYTY